MLELHSSFVLQKMNSVLRNEIITLTAQWKNSRLGTQILGDTPTFALPALLPYLAGAGSSEEGIVLPFQGAPFNSSISYLLFFQPPKLLSLNFTWPQGLARVCSSWTRTTR